VLGNAAIVVMLFARRRTKNDQGNRKYKPNGMSDHVGRKSAATTEQIPGKAGNGA
jgi:hypothetical protein